jgi:predicted restriction endonuclease
MKRCAPIESGRFPNPTQTRSGVSKRVLIAYDYACAVCGFDVRLGNQVLGLEAAHIQWHQAGGPDQKQNGLTLR